MDRQTARWFLALPGGVVYQDGSLLDTVTDRTIPLNDIGAAILQHITGSGISSEAASFEVGTGLFLVYRFTRDEASTAVQLLPLGAISWAIVGGVLNLMLRAIIRKALQKQLQKLIGALHDKPVPLSQSACKP